MKTNVLWRHMASVPWHMQLEYRTAWWIGKYTTHWQVGRVGKNTMLIYERNIQTFIKFEWGGLNPFVWTHQAWVLCLFFHANRHCNRAKRWWDTTTANRPYRGYNHRKIKPSRWKWPTIIRQECQQISFNNYVKINHTEPQTGVMDNKRCRHCICVCHFHINLRATCNNNTLTAADTEAVLQAMREVSLTEKNRGGHMIQEHSQKSTCLKDGQNAIIKENGKCYSLECFVLCSCTCILLWLVRVHTNEQ